MTLFLMLVLTLIIGGLLFRTSPADESRQAAAVELTQKSFPNYLV